MAPNRPDKDGARLKVIASARVGYAMGAPLWRLSRGQNHGSPPRSPRLNGFETIAKESLKGPQRRCGMVFGKNRPTGLLFQSRSRKQGLGTILLKTAVKLGDLVGGWGLGRGGVWGVER